jgi:hypothetical protein
MANRSYLVLQDAPDPIDPLEDDTLAVAAANYALPLLWVAAFRISDLRYVPRVVSDGDGVEETMQVPVLFARRTEAIDLFRARREFLNGNLPPDLVVHVDEFERLLGESTAQFCLLDGFEIWCMDAPEIFIANLGESLESFNLRTTVSWSRTLGDAGIVTEGSTFGYDPEVVRFALRGFEWSGPVPWKD